MYLTTYCRWERIQTAQSERLTLLLFCFSSDSSWPSGRLWLRVGWIHTTLLSQEGGPTGGSLSSWSSENSSSPSSIGREFRRIATVNTSQLFLQSQSVLLSEKETNLLSLRRSKGSQNVACWGSERPAGGWGHPGCKGQGTAGIKAHWTGYSPNWFSHCPPDLPSGCCCPSGTPEETTEFKHFL